MSRVSPTPVQVLVGMQWRRGTLRGCEISEDGLTCIGVVCFTESNIVQTARYPATSMMSMAGIPGCPADHDDQTCSATEMRGL